MPGGIAVIAEPGLPAVTPGGSGGDHHGTGLGLPPGVDDRGGAVAADDVAVPDVGLGVDRLADRAEDPQRRHVELVGHLVALLHERPDRGRGGVEERDAVVLDDLPPAARLGGGVGRALVEHLRDAVGERSVDDVGVAGDPADVGGAPVDVGVRLEVEDRVVRVRRPRSGSHRWCAGCPWACRSCRRCT